MSKKKPSWDAAASPRENAVNILPAMVSAYFEAGRELAATPVGDSGLHRLRLKGKRLRYTLELFRPMYGSGLDRYIQLLRDAQDHLGGLNDCAGVRTMLEAIPDSSAHKRKAVRFLEQRAAKGAAGFQKFWTETMDAPGLESKWIRYLERASRRISG